MTIEIYNGNELPYGLLSNNSIYLMELGKETYNTVTNYIYSNLLKSKEYFNILKNINTHDIHKYLEKYEKELTHKVIEKSMKESVDVKIKNKKIEELLLTTENYPIIYKSKDNILGNGENGKGLNLLGKYLVELRDELYKKYDTKESRMYNAYVASQLLEELISKDGNDLEEFSGLDQTEIIQKYIIIKAKEYSNVQKIDLSKLTHDEIVEKYNYLVKYPQKNMLELLNSGDNIKFLQLLEVSLISPEVLILYARKKWLRSARINQQNNIKNTIFDIYIDNIIQEKFPGLEKNKYQEVKNKELVMDYIEIELLKNQLYDFYKENLLPENVTDKITSNMNFDNLITEKQVNDAESINIEPLVKLEKNEDQFIILFEGDTELNDNPYTLFSPLLYTDMIIINSYNYPTIMHYILANLFITVPDIDTISNAHNYIVYDMEGDMKDYLNYDTIENISNIYEELKYDKYNTLKKQLAIEGLNKKFENKSLQDLLLSTGNNVILWNDPNDDVLGEGFSGGGENFVGTYLYKLRTKLSQIDDQSLSVKQEDVSDIIENDIFMRSWLEMRLSDICNVVKKVKKYMVKKHNLESENLIEAKYNKRWKHAIILGKNSNGTYIVKFDNGVVENDIEKKDIKITTGKSFEINIEFINNVLDNIYQPCLELMKEIKYINAEPPLYFLDLVRKCFGIQVEYQIIVTLWKRIIIMIYFILKHVPKLKNIKNVLTKIELLTSEKTTCVQIINNEDDNCIISAIINIVKGLREINNIYDYETDISKTDIETAVNIILNRGKNLLASKGEDLFKTEGEIDAKIVYGNFDNFLNDLQNNEEETKVEIEKEEDNDLYIEDEDNIDSESEDENQFFENEYETEDGAVSNNDFYSKKEGREISEEEYKLIKAIIESPNNEKELRRLIANLQNYRVEHVYNGLDVIKNEEHAAFCSEEIKEKPGGGDITLLTCDCGSYFAQINNYMKPVTKSFTKNEVERTVEDAGTYLIPGNTPDDYYIIPGNIVMYPGDLIRVKNTKPTLIENVNYKCSAKEQDVLTVNIDNKMQKVLAPGVWPKFVCTDKSCTNCKMTRSLVEAVEEKPMSWFINKKISGVYHIRNEPHLESCDEELFIIAKDKGHEFKRCSCGQHFIEIIFTPEEEEDIIPENNLNRKYKPAIIPEERLAYIRSELEKQKRRSEKKDRLKFNNQKSINKISLYLEANGIVSNNSKLIAEYILDAVNIIKKYKMSQKTKISRINFFATTM